MITVDVDEPGGGGGGGGGGTFFPLLPIILTLVGFEEVCFACFFFSFSRLLITLFISIFFVFP
jgi:hypothetical protein